MTTPEVIASPDSTGCSCSIRWAAILECILTKHSLMLMIMTTSWEVITMLFITLNDCIWRDYVLSPSGHLNSRDINAGLWFTVRQGMQYGLRLLYAADIDFDNNICPHKYCTHRGCSGDNAANCIEADQLGLLGQRWTVVNRGWPTLCST